ncbi:Uma2 family endonuclease, partial [Streptomyces sp. NPDC003832]
TGRHERQWSEHMGMDYAKMRAIASDLDAFAERLEGAWSVEIVSPSGPGHDYVDKLADYPAMGIPHYLIVDPRNGTVQVRSEPCGNRYRRHEPHIYGDLVPFGPWQVETAEFRRYGKAGDTVE